jgi:hypothetical protein
MGKTKKVSRTRKPGSKPSKSTVRAGNKRNTKSDSRKSDKTTPSEEDRTLAEIKANQERSMLTEGYKETNPRANEDSSLRENSHSEANQNAKKGNM